MSAETPEEFWYENLAKYRHPPEPQQIFPSNVVVEQLTKTKKTEKTKKFKKTKNIKKKIKTKNTKKT